PLHGISVDLLLPFLFFFSSRRRHTRFSRDWSSDVCSSDLGQGSVGAEAEGLDRLGCRLQALSGQGTGAIGLAAPRALFFQEPVRSEERRVGKECRSRWSADHWKGKAVDGGALRLDE